MCPCVMGVNVTVALCVRVSVSLFIGWGCRKVGRVFFSLSFRGGEEGRGGGWGNWVGGGEGEGRSMCLSACSSSLICMVLCFSRIGF